MSAPAQNKPCLMAHYAHKQFAEYRWLLIS